MKTFYDVIIREGLYSNETNLKFFWDYLFPDISFADKTVLEIGGGSGLLSLYAASKGAKNVICLEPELAGSTCGSSKKFDHVKKELKLDNVVLENNTFQGYDFSNHRFDIVLSYDSINHLNEKACENLSKSREAQSAYISILKQISEICVPGANLIIADCSRYNVFSCLGINNPFVPTIEWHKHQSPFLWIKMLKSVGFCNPIIRWRTYNKLGFIGKRVLANAFVSFFLSSHFLLKMKKS